MNIGANIKKFRKEKGLSQQELGNILGVSGAYIQQIESNKKNSSVKTLNKIALSLGVTIQELIAGEKQQVEIIEKDITQFSTDELLKEIVKRGFEITLKGR
ncbi:helix-turn-helix domain-containing protein [Paraclostridium bifermentans]|uniref:helix-turn-helix domain-containing protein n=1 Tax=Paraclostridium bifermentans TaxID=1490 RepID=UPI001F2C963F|nr:helix-turn-helix transcriptional regulator [Paraclostridium bifermentans]MCE9674899.1 helix-turn-helix domain-containing protein [Paraclostridium bifermentans]